MEIINKILINNSNDVEYTEFKPSMLPSIALNINKKIISLIEKKIQDFISIIHLLYQFTSTERKFDQLIENLFMNAFNFGKIYYDKCIKEFYISDKKKKKLMSEETAKKINKFIDQMKIEKENNNKTNIMEQIKKVNKSSSSIEDEDEEKSKIELYFAKDYFSIHFIEPLKDEDMKQIKEIFSPFFLKTILL